jgi:hypothetical protein
VASFNRLAVILLVCGLTLAASGDDVCLLCTVAPWMPATTLSVDDPNADFTALSEVRFCLG